MGLDFGKWVEQAGVNVGNDVLGRISTEFGGPQLPPLTVSDPFQNNNAYVESRESPNAPANGFVDQAVNNSRNLIVYGIAALVAFGAIALLLKKR